MPRSPPARTPEGQPRRCSGALKRAEDGSRPARRRTSQPPSRRSTTATRATTRRRAYMLGSALALWMNQPGIGLTPKRSALGFTTNPEATIDLPTTIDSLFKIVEAKQARAAPYYTAFWRGGQQAYLDLVNGAINALNADKLDSAQYYATQANKLYSGSPYGTMVLGNIASKKNNNDEAVKYWQQAAAAAASDTSYRDVRAAGARQHRQRVPGLGARRQDGARQRRSRPRRRPPRRTTAPRDSRHEGLVPRRRAPESPDGAAHRRRHRRGDEELLRAARRIRRRTSTRISSTPP